MKKFILTLFYIISLTIVGSVMFFLGRYVQGINQANTYPYHLRDVFAQHLPDCKTYENFKADNKAFASSIVEYKNAQFVRILTLTENNNEIKFLMSIINEKQENFIDEIWLECNNT